jgi:hypothetical protein
MFSFAIVEMMIGFELSASGSAEPFNFATEFQGKGRLAPGFPGISLQVPNGEERQGGPGRIQPLRQQPEGACLPVEIVPVSLRGQSFLFQHLPRKRAHSAYTYAK